MNLVQIIEPIPAPSIPTDTPTGKCYTVVREFDSVPDALDAISSGDMGNGPFDVITVNRQGVKLQPVTELVMDTGTAYGRTAPVKTAKPAATKPPAKNDKKDGKGDAKAPGK